MDMITLILERQADPLIPQGHTWTVSRRFTRLELLTNRFGPGLVLVMALEAMLREMDEYDRREREKKPKLPG